MKINWKTRIITSTPLKMHNSYPHLYEIKVISCVRMCILYRFEVAPTNIIKLIIDRAEKGRIVCSLCCTQQQHCVCASL